MLISDRIRAARASNGPFSGNPSTTAARPASPVGSKRRGVAVKIVDSEHGNVEVGVVDHDPGTAVRRRPRRSAR